MADDNVCLGPNGRKYGHAVWPEFGGSRARVCGQEVGEICLYDPIKVLFRCRHTLRHEEATTTVFPLHTLGKFLFCDTAFRRPWHGKCNNIFPISVLLLIFMF